MPAVAPASTSGRPYARPEEWAAVGIAMVCVVMAGLALALLDQGIVLVLVLVASSGQLPQAAPGVLQLVASFAFWMGAFGFVAFWIGVAGSAIAVPMWMHRCFRNLPALRGTTTRWSPG